MRKSFLVLGAVLCLAITRTVPALAVSAVELFRTAQRDYVLSSDSAVYSRPNLASQPIGEVHQGHNVHVIGVELNYLKIRMPSGLEGYVPISSRSSSRQRVISMTTQNAFTSCSVGRTLPLREGMRLTAAVIRIVLEVLNEDRMVA